LPNNRPRPIEIADQRRQDDALQAYLDQIGQLLLDKDRPLRQSEEGDEEQTLARARTRTVLARLDGSRKASVVQFLYESELIATDRPVLDLSGADLSEANLRYAGLSEADLSSAILDEANLREANLTDADLRDAQVGMPNVLVGMFSTTNLENVNLNGANLEGLHDITDARREQELTKEVIAVLGEMLEQKAKSREERGEELSRVAKSLEGATMPNGQKYEDWLKDREKRQQDE
jgi:uncharacterized protein YjbI with pentapeptide repeats